ncbi:uncharacterized protein LOC134948424 [Pseudophryne corroboree]|uniref:uncharacterized protein LOC134948424 n=1 Tax=Pseudophryne corroboree TaxID=495146 RepID=UPI003081A3C8
MRGSLLMLTITFCGIHFSLGANVLEDAAQNSDRLVLQRRDEEPQYPDDAYDSGEQDRWPTLEELSKYSSKRQLSHKRGQVQSPYPEQEESLGGSEGKMTYGKHPLTIKKLLSGQFSPEEEKEHIMRRQNLENSLYDLLSSKNRPAPDRRSMDNLRDLYASDLLKRHRMPRSPDYTSLKNEPSEDQRVSDQLVKDKTDHELVIG